MEITEMFNSLWPGAAIYTVGRSYNTVQFLPHSAVISGIWLWFLMIWVISDAFGKLSPEKHCGGKSKDRIVLSGNVSLQQGMKNCWEKTQANSLMLATIHLFIIEKLGLFRHSWGWHMVDSGHHLRNGPHNPQPQGHSGGQETLQVKLQM